MKSIVIVPVFPEGLDKVISAQEKLGYELVSVATYSLETATSYACFALHFRKLRQAECDCGIGHYDECALNT